MRLNNPFERDILLEEQQKLAKKQTERFRDLHNEFKFMMDLDESEEDELVDLIDQSISKEKRERKKIKIAIVSDRLNQLKQ